MVKITVPKSNAIICAADFAALTFAASFLTNTFMAQTSSPSFVPTPVSKPTEKFGFSSALVAVSTIATTAVITGACGGFLAHWEMNDKIQTLQRDLTAANGTAAKAQIELANSVGVINRLEDNQKVLQARQTELQSSRDTLALQVDRLSANAGPEAKCAALYGEIKQLEHDITWSGLSAGMLGIPADRRQAEHDELVKQLERNQAMYDHATCTAR